jgi:hypothetical protein
MKPSALYAVILIALLYMLSAQRASAQDTFGYAAVTYDAATNTVRGDAVTYPDYNVEAYYSSIAAIGLTSSNPDGSDWVYLGGETVEGPYYSTAELLLKLRLRRGKPT